MSHATTGRRPWLRAVMIGVSCAALGPATALAQGVTGQVTGRVLDADNRPIPSARVLLPALDLATVADAAGRFVLAGIPPGPHQLRVSGAGGEAFAAEVRVSAEARTVVTLRLGGPGGGATAEVDARSMPLGSRTTLTGELLRALPVDDAREALRAEPGVVEAEAAEGVVVRGAAPGDAAVFLDGVPLFVGGGRASGFGIPLDALEEVSVFTGPLSPAWGDAQSGVVNLVTRRGTGRFRGDVRAATDELLGGGTSHGLNRFDLSGGGSLGERLSLFAAASLIGEDAVPLGAGSADVLAFVPGDLDTTVTQTFDDGSSEQVPIPHFVQVSGSCDAAENQAESCRGRAFPRDWRTDLAGTVRADWRYASGSGLSVTAFMDRTQQRFWPAGLSFDPAANTGARRSALALVGRWTQRVSAVVTTEVAISRQALDVASGVLDSVWEAGHRDPTMGIGLGRMEFLADVDRFSNDAGAGAVTALESDADWDRLITNVLTNSGTRVPLLDQNQYRLAQPYRMNPWAAATGLPTQGLDIGYGAVSLDAQRHWTARAVATIRPGAMYRVRVGADWRASRFQRYRAALLSQNNMDVYDESPRQAGVFGDVRFTTSSALLEIGVRWDRFDANTIFPVTPGRIFTHPNFDPNDPTDPADSVFDPSRARGVVLPSVRAAWAPFSGTAVRLGVTRQARHPDEAAIYQRKNADLSFSSTNSVFGRDVDWPGTWVLELGVHQGLGAGITAEVAGWLSTRDRELTSAPQRFYDPAQGDSIRVLVTITADPPPPPPPTGPPLIIPSGRTVKGLDASVIARTGTWLDARLGYSFQDARETLVGAYSRKHTLGARVGVRAPVASRDGGWLGTMIRGGEAWMLFRLTSGLPYTRTVNQGLGTVSPFFSGQASEPIYASTTPAIRELDLKIVKRFTTRSVRWALVFDARNFLRFGNTLRVFTETGTVTNETHRDLVVNPELARLELEGGDRLVTTGSGLSAVDLRGDCSTWSGGAVNCVLLRRAEARWGNGDGLYDEDEQRTAFGAMYDLFFGPWTLRGNPRHMRFGIEIGL